MSTTLDRREFIAGYLVEAEEHIRLSNANLLAVEGCLQKKEPHPRLVRELFRSLHTLKGLSAMVGVEPIVELAHEMEAILRNADRSTGRLSLAAVELLLSGVRAIELRVAAFAAGKPVPAPSVELMQALGSLQPSAAPPPSTRLAQIALEPELLVKLSAVEQSQFTRGVSPTRHAFRLEYVPSPSGAAEGVSITTVRERLARLGEIVKVIPRAVPKNERAPGGLAFTLLVLSEVSERELAEAASLEPHAVSRIDVRAEPDEGPSLLPFLEDDDPIAEGSLKTGSIRVDIARLDEAMEKLSALVVTRFRLSRAVAELRERGADVRLLNTIVSEHTRQLRDLRGCITRARMVPVKELLERVPLIVRGMSRSTGKRVRLSIEAGSAELDKAVAERVFPAIVHLIRNAIDHAIEPKEERARLGKPEEGVLVVSCFEHSNTELELRVSDDGCGLDAARIAAKAGRSVPRTARELLELITLPGFSTVEHPTSSSGRGMGMDIVKRIAVDTLGGTLTLSTTPQVGTTFTLRIPLSISILDAFTFMCGEQAFVVPVSMVDEILELDRVPVFDVPAPNGGGVPLQLLERRGQTMPLFPLAGVFGMKATPHANHALVVRRDAEPFAFGVDRMLGQQEIVVRPLEDPLVKVAGIAGATDLGDGQPTLVIDLLGLIGLASGGVARATA